MTTPTNTCSKARDTRGWETCIHALAAERVKIANCVTCVRPLYTGDTAWAEDTHNVTPDAITTTTDYQCDPCHQVDVPLLEARARQVLATESGNRHAAAAVAVREMSGWTLQNCADLVRRVRSEKAGGTA
jgi:hypothetical protein